MAFLIDTYGEPSSHLLAMAGCIGATRYISHSGGKSLTSGQVRRIHGHGKRVVCNFEDSATGPQGGHGTGVEDARFSASEMRSVGAPRGVACYSSADYELHPGWSHWGATHDYFRGYTATLHAEGYLSGAYGNYDLIRSLLDQRLVDFGWQTAAWSYGKRDPRAVLVQDRFTNSYDRDSIQHDHMGAWLPSGAQVSAALIPPNVMEAILSTSGAPATYAQVLADIEKRCYTATRDALHDSTMSPNALFKLVEDRIRVAFQNKNGDAMGVRNLVREALHDGPITVVAKVVHK